MTKPSQPTKSTREWLAKHAAIVSDFKRLARKNGVRIPRHSKAFELAARSPRPSKGVSEQS